MSESSQFIVDGYVRENETLRRELFEARRQAREFAAYLPPNIVERIKADARLFYPEPPK